jgi:tetratricopeptide (TPR) repeat protein
MAETLGPRLGATARRAFTAAAIAVAAALAACRPSASSVPPSLPDGGAAPVAFALRRCVWRAHGATCGVPEDRRLVVVVEPLVGAATVEVDGATVAVARHEVAGAMSLELRPAIGARRLTVRAGAASGAGEAHFLLMEVPTPAPLVEAQRLRKGGQVAEARALAAELAKTSTDAWARARALGLVARIDRAQGRAASALEALEASAALLDERGEQTLAYRDRMVSAYVEIFETRRLDQALEIIQRVREIALDADGRMSADYHEALVALELGNSREALRLVRAARRSAERALDARMTGDAAQVEAQLLQALGRFAEADRLFARVADGSLGAGDDCRRSMALNNRAWLRLMDLGTSSLESVEPLDVVELVEASLRLKVGPCDVPLSRATALTNLAFGWLERDDIPKARAALIEARRVLPAPDARLLAWWHDVEGRIALREGRPSAARTTYKRLAALAEANALPGPRWRASVGLALAEEALGHVDAAARHHRDAERYLDADARTAPLGEGRSSFLSRFSPATEHHVAFLARVGRADDAADVARRARARLLDALQWAERIERLSPDAQARWASALAEHRGLRAELDAFGTDEWTLPKKRARGARPKTHGPRRAAPADDGRRARDHPFERCAVSAARAGSR